ncbi:hypothetical protein CKAH01_18851 [Colletotrichum kahawae]|uniref:Uncharacterized protein n=1 Tax=Colletotrichum kahawae TaxID=34407 RepID=A0AAE0D0T4_COLKA|nr:hypothetical protein CKAH01_18851 [Colletotrichum kahawae]
MADLLSHFDKSFVHDSEHGSDQDGLYEMFCEEFSVPHKEVGLFPENLESRRQAFREMQAAYLQSPLPHRRKLSKKAQLAQGKAWQAWVKFVTEDVGQDPDQVMIEFCLDSKLADSICQTFIESYVKRSARPCLRLGKQEVVNIRLRKRWEDPTNPAWKLMYHKKDEFASKPASKILKWIEGGLADKYKLERRQIFVKKEATIDDILTFIDILWTHASDIPCSAATRLAVHTTVFLDSLGGWKLGTLMNFKYRNIEIAVVRDPKDHKQTALAATINVEQNKR